MKTYTITTQSGRTLTYEAETQAGALRKHTESVPGEGVLGIVEASAYNAHANTLASYAE